MSAAVHGPSTVTFPCPQQRHAQPVAGVLPGFQGACAEKTFTRDAVRLHHEPSSACVDQSVQLAQI